MFCNNLLFNSRSLIGSLTREWKVFDNTAFDPAWKLKINFKKAYLNLFVKSFSILFVLALLYFPVCDKCGYRTLFKDFVFFNIEWLCLDFNTNMSVVFCNLCFYLVQCWDVENETIWNQVASNFKSVKVEDDGHLLLDTLHGITTSSPSHWICRLTWQRWGANWWW